MCAVYIGSSGLGQTKGIKISESICLNKIYRFSKQISAEKICRLLLTKNLLLKYLDEKMRLKVS